MSGGRGPGAREERPPRPAALTRRLPGERAALLAPRAAAAAALGCAPSGPSSSTETVPQRATADGSSARPARPLLAATRFGSGRPRPARAHSARAQTGQPAAARSPPPPPPPSDAHPARLPGAPRLLSARPPPRHTHTFSPFSELEHRSGREAAAARGGRAQGAGAAREAGPQPFQDGSSVARPAPGSSPRPRLPAPLRSHLPPALAEPGRDGHGRSSGAGGRTATFGCRGPPGRGRREYGGLGLPLRPPAPRDPCAVPTRCASGRPAALLPFPISKTPLSASSGL